MGEVYQGGVDYKGNWKYILNFTESSQISSKEKEDSNKLRNHVFS